MYWLIIRYSESINIINLTCHSTVYCFNSSKYINGLRRFLEMVIYILGSETWFLSDILFTRFLPATPITNCYHRIHNPLLHINNWPILVFDSSENFGTTLSPTSLLFWSIGFDVLNISIIQTTIQVLISHTLNTLFD